MCTGKHPALARATVSSLSTAQITLFLPKPLHLELLEAAPGCPGSAGAGLPARSPSCSPRPRKPAKLVWRIDRDEPASTFVRMRQNLTGAQLLCQHVVQHWRLDYGTPGAAFGCSHCVPRAGRTCRLSNLMPCT